MHGTRKWRGWGQRLPRKETLQYCMVGTVVLFLLGASETTGIYRDRQKSFDKTYTLYSGRWDIKLYDTS